jgi:hypothetical protein
MAEEVADVLREWGVPAELMPSEAAMVDAVIPVALRLDKLRTAAARGGRREHRDLRKFRKRLVGKLAGVAARFAEDVLLGREPADWTARLLHVPGEREAA